MNTRLLVPIICWVVLVIQGCSSDSGSESDIPDDIEVTQASIQAFSKLYAYIGETVDITGENLGNKIEDTKVYLDDQEVEVIAVTPTNIRIKIPEGTSSLPELKIEIPNTSITFQDTYKRIAILDNTPETWIHIPHNFNAIQEVKDFKALEKEEVYFAIKNDSPNNFFEAKITDNGGTEVRVLDSYYNFFRGAIHVSAQGTEYSLRAGHLYRKKKDEESQLIKDFSGNNIWIYDLFVSENEKEILVVGAAGHIYKSTDGETFQLVHENSEPSSYEFEAFYAISSEQAWLAGYNFPEGDPTYNPAKTLYIKDDGNWHNELVQIDIKDGNYEYIQKIHFTDAVNGFAIARINNYIAQEEKYVILKSETKGDTWRVIHQNDQKIESFAFMNNQTGWYTTGNEIHKTTDGGNTWGLAYTHNTECKGILYNEGVLWVLVNGGFLKYYLP